MMASISDAHLSDGEKAILKRLQNKPIDLRWGKNGWVPDALPKSARRSDFDSLCERRENLVKIVCAQLILADTPAT